ncbi:MAG: substrate-binding domain-containing protein [Bacteroidia bacterium]|nr:substrate-binding domain-containing protein [Bacteroidia bacterium]
MKTIRNHCYIGFLLAAAFFLTGCFQTKTNPVYKVAFSQCTSGDVWRQEMEAAMLREKEFHPSLELEIVDALANSEKQIRDIDSLVNSGIDLLIVSPNEAEPITPVVERVFSSGIPVIILDRKTDSKLYTSYIGANNFEIGRTAGNYIKNLANGLDEVKIVEIWGTKGSSPAQNRHKGFSDVISTNPKLRIVDNVFANWEADGVDTEFKKTLDSLVEFDIIFAHNDRMALKAYQMLRERGLENKVDIIGVDGLSGPRGGLQQVEDGILEATLLYPHGGEEAIRMAEDILMKKPVVKDNILQSTIINQTNVRILKMQAEKLASQQEQISRQQKKINDQTEIFRDQNTALYILIFSLITALVLGAMVYYSLMTKQEANLELETKNIEILEQQAKIVEMAAKAEEATKAKIKFFTNISHEFRTPLTLILGPVEELLSGNLDNKPQIKKDLSLMKKNAMRLLRLINQLMDFRKIENNKMVLKVGRVDFRNFVAEIFEVFEETARRRGIRYSLKIDLTDRWLWVDAEMIDKVLFNLLSNAFKFTIEGGEIWIKASDSDSMVFLEVGDNGRGMSKEHVEHAFDRFYQGETYQTKGTGLGLSLSQELIQLHKGEISVESEKGVGTRFYIGLKKGKLHFNDSDFVLTSGGEKKNSFILPFMVDESAPSRLEPPTEEERGKNYTVLLIEDNEELSDFLKKTLSREYIVLKADDAEQGLKIASKEVPDLIVCDIMLPGQDGRAFTKAIKSDINTSHIPVILLTAQSKVSQRLKGIQAGADLYLTKPFSISILAAHIRNLINNRNLIKDSVKDSEPIFVLPTEKMQLKINPTDKKFIKEFKEIVSANMMDSSFGVMDLCERMGLSRVQLYRKVKALLGYTVSDYIKELRLLKAKELIMKNELSIAEIAYSVGFTSPAYFSTAFKSHYQLSPSDFRNSIMDKK